MERNISLKGWVGIARSHKSSRLKLKDVSRLVNTKIIAVLFFFFFFRQSNVREKEGLETLFWWPNCGWDGD